MESGWHRGGFGVGGRAYYALLTKSSQYLGMTLALVKPLVALAKPLLVVSICTKAFLAGKVPNNIWNQRLQQAF